MNALTFLSAFQSECGRKGRVWTRGSTFYRRTIDDRLEYMPHGHEEWKTLDRQIVTMEGEVHWADEPKTLTPQEALRALADGKVLIDKDLLWKLGGDGCIYTKYGSAPWEECPSQSFNDWHVVPDPSQPAEQRRDWNPFGPYEDMPADVQRDIETERGHAKAESRVEYPKSSCSCMGDASCPCRRNK